MVRVDRPGGAIGRCSALAELHHALNPPKTATRGHELARTAVRATVAHPAGMAAEPTPSPKSPKSTSCHVANVYEVGIANGDHRDRRLKRIRSEVRET